MGTIMKRYISIIIFFILLSNVIITIALSQNQINMNQHENTIEIILTFPQPKELQFKSNQNKQIIFHYARGGGHVIWGDCHYTQVFVNIHSFNINETGKESTIITVNAMIPQ